MALADTARLIASLELQDKFSGPAGRAERNLGGLEGKLQRAGRQAGIFSTAIGTALGVGLERVVRSGVGLLTSAITGGVEALNELESVQTATATVLESTNGVAGQTAEGIRALAEEYESLNATIDDKVIQSGANLLLTFTNIREDAFEPALEAALNMNQAMGGGPEGLQSTIIQVGKALNDPIRGVTALRRVGVQLTQEQEKQIKTLVEQNDLYGAQQIIIEELGTQFGGQFAAAGKTAEGSQAKLRDTMEDLQKNLAGPLIPAIDRVREKLIDLLSSPAAASAAGKLGDAIAGVLSEENLDKAAGFIESALGKLEDIDFSKVGKGVEGVFGFLGEVPWGAIGEGLKITGQAAKIAVDAFLALPKEVQGIVVGALAVNKLSGGIAGSLVSGGLKGILGQLRGSTPATPMYVTNVGGVPGVGGPVGTGPTGGVGGALRTVGALAAIPLAGAAVVEIQNFDAMRDEALVGLEGILDNMPRDTADEIDRSIAKIEGQLNDHRPLLEGVLFNTNIRPALERELEELRTVKAYTERGAAAARDAIPWAQRNRDEIHNLNMSEGRRFATTSGKLSAQLGKLDTVASKTGAVAGAVAGQSGILKQIRDKPSNTLVKNTINVTVPTYVNASMVGTNVYRTVYYNGYAQQGSQTVL